MVEGGMAEEHAALSRSYESVRRAKRSAIRRITRLIGTERCVYGVLALFYNNNLPRTSAENGRDWIERVIHFREIRDWWTSGATILWSVLELIAVGKRVIDFPFWLRMCMLLEKLLEKLRNIRYHKNIRFS